VPKWTELAPSVLVIAAAVIAFHYAAIYLDILPKANSTPPARTLDSEQWARLRLAVQGLEQAPAAPCGG